ncbi:MAG: AtpZ/AtpI family protein [bacterium]|nr:AtpZ/AtpI family protein [bacterium]
METTPEKKSDRVYYMFALRIVGDFGATIAIPVVVLAMLGQYLDNKYSTQPIFLVAGFVIAFVFSAVSIYRKAKKYGADYQKLK